MSTTSLTGKVIGGYRIEEKIGTGGFAEVYRARQLSLGRAVAVKVLTNPQYIRRFAEEAAVVLSLQHPNIVRVLDAREQGGIYFIVMEYIEGPSLKQILQSNLAEESWSTEDDTSESNEGTRIKTDDEATVLRNGTGSLGEHTITKKEKEAFQGAATLLPGEVAKIAVDVGKALMYAHKKGVVHRDVKPGNILLSPQDKAMLSDFGIAKILSEAGMTQTGMLIGSIPYMSPEQIRGDKKIDGRADIYSLGVVMYEMLTGMPPFTGNSTAIMQKHLVETPVPPSEVISGVSPDLDRIILKCLAKEPAERYQTVENLIRDIESSVRPVSLRSLLGISLSKGEAESHEEKDNIKFVCPRCGYEFSAPKHSVFARCPACGHKVSLKESKNIWENEKTYAKKFVEGFDLDPGLDLNIRLYEYRKRIESQLEKSVKGSVAKWRKAISAGSVVEPVVENSHEKRKPKRITEAAKELFRSARLWNFVMASTFWVSGDPELALSITDDWKNESNGDLVTAIPIDEEQKRKKIVSGFVGKAYYLIGLYRTVQGARETQHDNMVREYRAAEKGFGKAEAAFGERYPELKKAVSFSRNLSGLIAHYFGGPEQYERYEKALEQLRPEVEQILPSMPWLEKDLKVASLYEDAQGRFEKIAAQLRKEISSSLKRASNLLDDRDRKMKRLEEEEKETRDSLIQQQRRIQDNYKNRINNIKDLHSWITVVSLIAPWLLALIVTAFLLLLTKQVTYREQRLLFGGVLFAVTTGFMFGELIKGVPRREDLILLGYIAATIGFRLVPWITVVISLIWLLALWVASTIASESQAFRNVFWWISIASGLGSIFFVASLFPMKVIIGLFMIVGVLSGYHVQKDVVNVEYESMEERGRHLQEAYKEAFERITSIRKKKRDIAESANDEVEKLLSTEVNPKVENLKKESQRYSLLLLRKKSPEKLSGLDQIVSEVRSVKGRLLSKDMLDKITQPPTLPVTPPELSEEAFEFSPPSPILKGGMLVVILVQVAVAFVLAQLIWKGNTFVIPFYRVTARITPTAEVASPVAQSGSEDSDQKEGSKGIVEKTTHVPTSTPMSTPTLKPSPTEEPYIITPPISKFEYKYVTAYNLNVRRGPGVEYEVIGKLSKGEKVEVTGRNYEDTWSYIQSPVEGWVSSHYLSSSNPAEQNHVSRGVRFTRVSCPGESAKIARIEPSGVWWRIYGTAHVANFSYWKMELSNDGKHYGVLFRAETPVVNGHLMDFRTDTVPPGVYLVRLMVVDNTGNYPNPCVIRVRIP